jgi:hypothetical protein
MTKEMRGGRDIAPYGVLDKPGWQAGLREIRRSRLSTALALHACNAWQTTLAATCLEPREPHPLDHADSPS